MPRRTLSHRAMPLLLVILMLCPSVLQAAKWENIDEFNTGKPLAGLKLSTKQLRGKLVIFTTWNANESSATADAQALKKVVDDTAPGTVILIATQFYEMSEDVVLAEWKKCKLAFKNRLKEC